MGHKFGSQLRRGTQERLKEALEQDSNIVYDISKLDNAAGATEAYLTSLGLRKSDLLRLERVGFAIRGYTRVNSGHRVRWILLATKGEDVGTLQQKQGKAE